MEATRAVPSTRVRVPWTRFSDLVGGGDVADGCRHGRRCPCLFLNRDGGFMGKLLWQTAVSLSWSLLVAKKVLMEKREADGDGSWLKFRSNDMQWRVGLQWRGRG